MYKIQNLLSGNKYQRERVFLFYLVSALAIHIDRFILGFNAVFNTHDTFELFWPYQRSLAERVYSLELPGWLPDYLGGMPFFLLDINLISINVLTTGLFPDPWNYTATTIVQFLIAGIGTHLFMKYFFQMEDRICFLAGLIWALGVFNITYWRVPDLASIPLLFYCTDKIVSSLERREKILLLLGIFITSLNIQFARGAPFIAFFHLIFIFFSSVSWDHRKKVLFSFVLVWGFVTLINLPLILTQLFNVESGFRNLVGNYVTPYQSSFIQRAPQLIQYLVFDGHSEILGVIGSLAFVYALWCFNSWNKLSKFIFYYLIGTLIFLIFIDKSAWFISFRQHMNLIPEFRLSRFILVGPFIIFVIAFSNFARFLSFIQGNINKIVIYTISLSGIISCWWFFKHPFPLNFPSNQAIGLINFSFAIVFIIGIVVIRKKKAKKITYLYLIICVIFLHSFVKANVIRLLDTNPPSMTHFFHSELFDKYKPLNKYDYRIAFINWHPTVGLFNNYQVAGGLAPQYLKLYALFWKSLLDKKDTEFTSYMFRAYLLDNRYIKDANPPHIINDIRFNTDLLSLHNVRYIFSFYEILQPDRWGLSLIHEGVPPVRPAGYKYDGFNLIKRFFQILDRIDEPIHYYVYEIDNYLPRVFTTKNYYLVEDEDDMEEYLRKNDRYALLNQIVYNKEYLSFEQKSLLMSLAEHELPLRENGLKDKSNYKISYYSDNKIIIDVNTDGMQQLVLMENYSNEWKVYVNGTRVPIFPAYGAFRSLIINKGDNHVVFVYDPDYLILSYYVSFGAIAFFVVFGIFWISKANNKTPMNRYYI